MPKNALIISGGGSRGAFAVGAVDHLVNRADLEFDIVAGTSTGSLIAPLVVLSKDDPSRIDRLKQVYTSVTTEDVIVAHPLVEAVVNEDALYDATPLRALIMRDIDEAAAQALFASDTQMFITGVNLNTGQTVFFQTGPEAVNPDPSTRLVSVRDRDTLIRAIEASTHEPVFMPPVAVLADAGAEGLDDDGRLALEPTDRYVDGGVRDIAPIKIAIDNGATDVYAIVLSTRERERSENAYTSVVNILLRTIDLFTQEITKKDVGIATLFNEGARYLAALKDALTERTGLNANEVEQLFDEVDALNPFRDTNVVNLHVIRPEEKLPGTGLEFKPLEMAQLMRLGRDRARDVLEGEDDSMPLIA